MTTILVLGFLLGLRHALDGDHVAAVASLVARRGSRRGTVLQGTAWGLGHALTLFAACSVVLFLDTAIPERVAGWLEALVGVMLVALGADLLRRVWRDRVHFHVHRHEDGTVHLHAHSHRGDDLPHRHSDHDHEHPRSLPLRALGVGMMHGLAGSAALIVLTVESTASPATGLVYVALFGLGATAGMALLTAVIAIPLSASARHLGRLHGALQATVATVTMTFGSLLLVNHLAP